MNVFNSNWTQTFTNSNFAYVAAAGQNNLTNVTIYLVSGTATLTGGDSFGGTASDAVNIPVGVPINLGSANNLPMYNFTVTTGGTSVFIIVATLNKNV